jgi:hypothetical protein
LIVSLTILWLGGDKDGLDAVGLLTTGSSLSLTVTVKEHDAEPKLLIAVAVTVVVPIGNTDPDAGE